MYSTENHGNFSEERLSAIVNQYPYYHLAQFWLLANYSNTHIELLEKQTAKTALYFCNYRWLNHQLYNHKNNRSEVLNTVEFNSESIVETPANLSLKPNDNNEIFIPVEPLHTIDYFASQGIKINQDPITNDKLGSQLKSFTEWLKTMKKIQGDKLSQGDENTDKKIRNIAETSNTNTEVVTESMAEVLIKQDKTDKAIEVYQKLSLNNPSKSAYFAAKIQSLKTH